jgi:hypothetical protein
MMEQALAHRVMEDMAPMTAPCSTNSTKRAATIATTKDPALKAALTKASKGQSLTPDEQKLVAGAALMKTENRLRRCIPYTKRIRSSTSTSCVGCTRHGRQNAINVGRHHRDAIQRTACFGRFNTQSNWYGTSHTIQHRCHCGIARTCAKLTRCQTTTGNSTWVLLQDNLLH